MQAVGSGSWIARLRRMALDLPNPPEPLGAYAAASQAGDLLFLSGMLPLRGSALAFAGRIGDSLSIEQGRQAAALAALNGLAVAARFVGDVAHVRRVARLSVLIAADPEFTQHAEVADGASELLRQVFAGEPGHTRVVSGAASLALGAPVALEMILECERRHEHAGPERPGDAIERADPAGQDD